MLQRLSSCRTIHALVRFNPSLAVKSFVGPHLIGQSVEGLSTLKKVSLASAAENVGKSAASLTKLSVATTRIKSVSDKLDTVSTKKYADGYVYEGNWHEGEWAGKGKLTSAAGQMWEGEFKEGKIYKGTGVVVFPDGDVYEGNWVKGKMEGKGQWTQTNGSYLNGEFKNDTFYSGVGVLVHMDGTVSKGTWVEGRVEGEVVKYNNLVEVSDNYKEVVNPDGSLLRGEFKRNKIYNGSGKMWLPDESSVEGTWVEGNLKGHANLAYANGNTYVGELVNLQRFGYGVLTHSTSGEINEGTWVNGKLQGQAKVTYPNGDIYIGEVVTVDGNARRDGYELMTYSNGGVFEGTWGKNKRRGKGKLTNLDNTVLEGEWKEDKIYNGQGVLFVGHGVAVGGTWVKGKLQGQAKVTYPSGNSYIGEVVVELNGFISRDGNGVMTYTSGELYKGTWQKGNRHGKGKLTNADGTVLEGEWREDKMYNGSGVMFVRHGIAVKGTWVEGKIQGQAKVTYPSGNSYIGEVVVELNGFISRDGNGVMTYTSGEVYEGMWEKGAYHGQVTITRINGSVCRFECRKGQIYNASGILLFPDGTVYEGTWVDGKLQGQAKVAYTRGNTYVGELVGQQRHGFGVMTSKNGDVFEGMWVENKLHGPGKITYATGDAYEGELKCHKLNGCGVMTYSNVSVYEGMWEHGECHGQGKLTNVDGSIVEGEWKEGKFCSESENNNSSDSAVAHSNNVCENSEQESATEGQEDINTTVAVGGEQRDGAAAVCK